jgi:hypothetical protein
VDGDEDSGDVDEDDEALSSDFIQDDDEVIEKVDRELSCVCGALSREGSRMRMVQCGRYERARLCGRVGMPQLAARGIWFEARGRLWR